jgi:cytochrome c2
MRTRSLALFISFALTAFALPLPASAQISIIPGSSARGAELFRKKSCVECHASNAPRASTPMMLATALWNHSPKMWLAQQQRQIRPMLDSTETSDLFAYFFSLTYFTVPGDANRGARIFDERSCSRCHAVAVDRRITAAHTPTLRTAPPISTWSDVSDPLVWAERMWNHSGAVYAELASEGVSWPKFSTTDMLDLLAYLRTVPESPSPSVNFQVGDPEFGRLVFESSCESCHSFGSSTAEHKIDFVRRPAPDLLTGYITAMWNHAPAMRQLAGTKFPMLGPGDMSNLVAYLFAQRYFDEEGNPERGARVFEAKNCALCHDLKRQQVHAPDLAAATERFSPVTIAAAVWRHGPAMQQMMREQEVAWPTFRGSEMPDLIAFLNKRLMIRMSRP